MKQIRIPYFSVIRFMDIDNINIHNSENLRDNFKIELYHRFSQISIWEDNGIILLIIILKRINLHSVENKILTNLNYANM